MPPHNVAIIGAGSVGSTIASFLMWEGVFEEVLMVDIDMELCKGQVMDLSDASFLTDTAVRVGSFQDAANANIVIITAGAKQRKGETREKLLKRNVKILRAISNSMGTVSEHTIVLLVANPVDILTQVFQEISGIPKTRVIGSGTFLDSMRLRTDISRRLDVAVSHVHAYVVGMHGDCQVALFSNAQIAGVSVSEYGKLKEKDLKQIADDTRDKAYKIIKAKGSTYYSIGACVAKLSRGMMQDRRGVFQLSVWSDKYGCYLSWPSLVGSKGIIKLIPLQLKSSEEQVVARAAQIIKKGATEALRPAAKM